MRVQYTESTNLSAIPAKDSIINSALVIEKAEPVQSYILTIYQCSILHRFRDIITYL